MGAEESQRVSGLHYKSLVLGDDLQVLLDKEVLHPVLADLAGLAIGHQFIGVEGHREVEVVVDHDLHGPALDAFALVGVDGEAVEGAFGPEAVAVDPAARAELG